jgi:hypothetical protein
LGRIKKRRRVKQRPCRQYLEVQYLCSTNLRDIKVQLYYTCIIVDLHILHPCRASCRACVEATVVYSCMCDAPGFSCGSSAKAHLLLPCMKGVKGHGSYTCHHPNVANLLQCLTCCNTDCLLHTRYDPVHNRRGGLCTVQCRALNVQLSCGPRRAVRPLIVSWQLQWMQL